MAENEQTDASSLMDSIADEVGAEGAETPEVDETPTEEAEKEAQKRMLELREKSLEVSEAATTVAVEAATENGSETVDDMVSATGSGIRGEVSASTIGRMMGLVTSAEFKLLENKLDLLSTRMNSMLVKMEKVLVMTADMPNGADLERIDVQIADLRTILTDIKTEIVNTKEETEDKKTGGSILSN